jgi:hypothetical protein
MDHFLIVKNLKTLPNDILFEFLLVCPRSRLPIITMLNKRFTDICTSIHFRKTYLEKENRPMGFLSGALLTFREGTVEVGVKRKNGKEYLALDPTPTDSGPARMSVFSDHEVENRIVINYKDKSQVVRIIFYMNNRLLDLIDIYDFEQKSKIIDRDMLYTHLLEETNLQSYKSAFDGLRCAKWIPMLEILRENWWEDVPTVKSIVDDFKKMINIDLYDCRKKYGFKMVE